MCAFFRVISTFAALKLALTNLNLMHDSLMNDKSITVKKKEFEKIYNRFFSFFYQVAFHFLHQEEDAKEVVQESFIKLWEKNVYTKSEPEIKNYLFIIVRNRCLNLLRDQRRNLRETNIPDYLVASINYKLLNETGEDILLCQELSEKIQVAIAGLTPQCKAVFSLSRFEDMSNSEIAQKLNISIKAVEASMTRALKKLREELSPYLSEENEKGSKLHIQTVLLSFL